MGFQAQRWHKNGLHNEKCKKSISNLGWVQFWTLAVIKGPEIKLTTSKTNPGKNQQNTTCSSGLASLPDSQHILRLHLNNHSWNYKKRKCGGKGEEKPGQNTHYSLVFYFCNQYRFPVPFSATSHKVSLSLQDSRDPNRKWSLCFTYYW